MSENVAITLAAAGPSPQAQEHIPRTDPSKAPVADQSSPSWPAYLVPFSIMQEWLDRSASRTAGLLDMKYDDFLDLVRHFLATMPVDEDWYCTRYPGVGERIASRSYQSAAYHFAMHGYFENRLPFSPEQSVHRLPASFSSLKTALQVVPTRGGLRVRISQADLFETLRGLLVAIPVDESWYRATYPGVSEAIDGGMFPNAAHHFLKHGYFECRWPFDMPVDADWYLTRYADARVAVENGSRASARDHFRDQGYRQGRLPAKYWFTSLWDRKRIGAPV